MSRVGKQPVKIAQGVKVQLDGKTIRVEGPKGKLARELPLGVVVKVEGDKVLVNRDEQYGKKAAERHGLIRTLIANMVHGVSTGFEKNLVINGVGYRAAVKGDVLSLTLGYSHPIDYKLPAGVKAAVNKNTEITVSSADKNLLGDVAAKIRAFRAPEPYQGKGIKYADERIIRKQGKAAGAK